MVRNSNETRIDSEEATGQKRKSSAQKKDELYWQILNAAIYLDFQKGHQKWTISDLSRTSKVGRSLIYYYFGKSRLAILTEAVHLIGDEIFGLNEPKIEKWKSGNVVDSVISAREFVEKAPYLAPFYFTHRVKQTEIGESFRAVEKKHFEKLRTFLTHRSDEELRALFGIFLGLVIAPDLTKDTISKVVSKVLEYYR